MMFMDNFSLLDNPKTTGTMDLTFLKAKYRTVGSPNARISSENEGTGRKRLVLLPRAATPAAPWLIMKDMDTTFGPSVVGMQITATVGGLGGSASMGLVSRLSPTMVGIVFSFERQPGKLILRYRNSLGEPTQVDVPLPSENYFFDVYFNKVSNGNDYSRLTVSIDNTPIFHSMEAFCNYGSDLSFVIGGLLRSATTTGSSFYAEQDLAIAVAQNTGYYVNDFYITEGVRYGKPVVVTTPITSVDSTLTADIPMVDLLGGVPNYSEYASGSGLTDVTFTPVAGEIAQFSALVQKNSPAVAEVQVGIDGQLVDKELGDGLEYVPAYTGDDVGANGVITI